MQRHGVGLGKAQRNVSEYYSRNFYVTTSGHFHTRALLDAISEQGVDHMMFSVDYPYEYIEPATTWFDHALLSENDSQKIGSENAKRLFRLP